MNIDVGRRRKDFCELTYDAKRKRVASVTASTSCEEVVFAAGMTLRSSGKKVAANLLNESLKSPNRASKIAEVWEKSKQEDGPKNIQSIGPLPSN